MSANENNPPSPARTAPAISAKGPKRVILPIRESKPRNQNSLQKNDTPSSNTSSANAVQTQENLKRKAEGFETTRLIMEPDASKVRAANTRKEFEESRVALAKGQDEFPRTFGTVQDLAGGGGSEFKLAVVQEAYKDGIDTVMKDDVTGDSPEFGVAGALFISHPNIPATSDISRAEEPAQTTPQPIVTNSTRTAKTTSGNHIKKGELSSIHSVSEAPIENVISDHNVLPSPIPGNAAVIAKQSEISMLEENKQGSTNQSDQENQKLTGRRLKYKEWEKAKKTKKEPKLHPAIRLTHPFPSSFVNNRSWPRLDEMKTAGMREHKVYSGVRWSQQMWQGIIVSKLGEEVEPCTRCVELGDKTIMRKCKMMRADGNWVRGCNNCWWDGVKNDCCL